MASTAADKVSYEDLYPRWEKGNWSATELDFSEDRRQWEEDFNACERKAALWNYALFFWGEDAVADDLSPYIDAAPPRSRSTSSRPSRSTRRATPSSSGASCTRSPGSATGRSAGGSRRSGPS